MATPGGHKIMANGAEKTVIYWIGHNLLAIVMAVVALIYWIGHKLSTRDQIKEDITEAVSPLAKELSRLSTHFREHSELPAHPVSMANMRALEKRLDELKVDVKEILKIAKNGQK